MCNQKQNSLYSKQNTLCCSVDLNNVQFSDKASENDMSVMHCEIQRSLLEAALLLILALVIFFVMALMPGKTIRGPICASASV